MLYNFSQYEILKLYTVHNKEIEIVTGINHARTLLIKLLESEILCRSTLSIDLSDTGLTDDELRDIFDKPARIETLNISRCKIGDKGLRILSIS